MEPHIRPLILAVDDTPKHLDLISRVLERDGYESTLAVDGYEALEFAAKEKPALILLDVVMPGMDGLEVCRRLKADPVTRDIPVIFLTGQVQTDDILAGFKAGAVDYVTKPFRFPELMARVHVHVALRLAKQEIQTLRSILPVCGQCKQIQDEQGTWHSLGSFLSGRSEARVSHGLCPDCAPIYFSDFGEKVADP